MDEVSKLYKTLNKTAAENLNSEKVTNDIFTIASESLRLLKKRNRRKLLSHIPDKEYFVFENGSRKSRPVNSELFLDDISDYYGNYLHLSWKEIEPEKLSKLLYTIAISYCALRDAFVDGDKKTPSIFFEIFTANIFAREYNANPSKKIIVDKDGISTSLPTDYLFTPAKQDLKIHLPIKLSTRERSIQAWAHQKVLEGIYGKGRFRGVMVVLNETNYVAKDNSVVDVCLPDQWRLYQMYISEMTRIYYLDIPQKYADLVKVFPHIQVKKLSSFFKEKMKIISVDF